MFHILAYNFYSPFVSSRYASRVPSIHIIAGWATCNLVMDERAILSAYSGQNDPRENLPENCSAHVEH